jgi:hypothetical protein
LMSCIEKIQEDRFFNSVPYLSIDVDGRANSEVIENTKKKSG